MTKRDSRCRPENIGEASCSVVEDAFSARFIGEDEVFGFICELDATIELQEELGAADDIVV